MKTRRHALLALLAGTAALAGCALPQVSDYADQRPVLELERYFNGRVHAHGIFQQRGGAVVRRFTVVMDCRWEGNQGVLDERFTYSDGSTQRRVWTITRLGDGRYRGTADDVVGEAQGEAAGKWLLGCRPDAVHIAASKHATAARLAGAGVTTVPTFATPDLLTGAVVAKPDDGVGCEDTLLFADAAAAQAWHDTPPRAMHVFQPYVAGESLSLSLLCCDGQAQLLSVNRQHVRLAGDHFEFHGVTVNALGDGDGRYAALAARVAAAIPGLWGYVGVDLIAGAFGPMVLEVNPRATVSYAGLRAALDCNPAQHVLALPEMRPCRGLRPVTLEMTHV